MRYKVDNYLDGYKMATHHYNNLDGAFSKAMELLSGNKQLSVSFDVWGGKMRRMTVRRRACRSDWVEMTDTEIPEVKDI